MAYHLFLVDIIGVILSMRSTRSSNQDKAVTFIQSMENLLEHYEKQRRKNVHDVVNVCNDALKTANSSSTAWCFIESCIERLQMVERTYESVNNQNIYEIVGLKERIMKCPEDIPGNLKKRIDDLSAKVEEITNDIHRTNQIVELNEKRKPFICGIET